MERDGQIEIYSILCAFDDQMHGEVPQYGNDSVFKLLQRHEISPSFVNRVTDMYLEAVLEYEYLLAPIQAEMDKLNYGSWITCFNEHVARAVTARYAFTDSRQEGHWALDQEQEAGFIYINVLTQALAEYENNRDIYPDLISFYPSLLEALGQ